MSQVLATSTTTAAVTEVSTFGLSDTTVSQFTLYRVLRRNSNVVDFDPSKIAVAMTKAFLAVEGSHGADSSKVRDLVGKLTGQVVETLMRRLPEGGVLHIEHIQDQVELALMRTGEQEVARRYVLYREARSKERIEREVAKDGGSASKTAPAGPNVLRIDGTSVPLSKLGLEKLIGESCSGLAGVDEAKILESTISCLYEGVQEGEVVRSTIMSARALIEQEPAYNYATARLLLHQIRLEVLGESVLQADMKDRYAVDFP